MKIGTRIKELRKEQKITQDRLSEYLGISPQTVKDIENQGFGTLLFEKFHEYINAKNCCFSYLITEADNYQAHRFYKKWVIMIKL